MLSRANRIRMFFKGTPVTAFIATFMGALSLVLFVITAVMSIMGSGEAGIIIGIMGVSSMLCNVIGFAMAAGSTKGEKEIYYGLPLFAVVFNGVMFIIYMTFYVYGLMISL